MTNETLIDTLKEFGDKGTKSSGTPTRPSNQPIYGPSANPPPLPTNTGGSPGGQALAGPYPQIFGPPVNTAPGTGGPGSGGRGTGSNPVAPGQTASDQPGPADQAFEFNPELRKAFPYDGAPQPFLTDFSKIQH